MTTPEPMSGIFIRVQAASARASDDVQLGGGEAMKPIPKELFDTYVDALASDDSEQMREARANLRRFMGWPRYAIYRARVWCRAEWMLLGWSRGDALYVLLVLFSAALVATVFALVETSPALGAAIAAALAFHVGRWRQYTEQGKPLIERWLDRVPDWWFR